LFPTARSSIVTIMGLFRKLLRRTFYTAAALSTLLLLATLILWPTSSYRRVAVVHSTAGKTITAISGLSGRAVFATALPAAEDSELYLRMVDGPADTWSYFTWEMARSGPLPTAYVRALGFTWEHTVIVANGPAKPWVVFDATNIKIPFSYLALLFSILPMLAFRSLRRRRKLARAGLCKKCHYDLRAHAPGDNCPECGAPYV